MDLDTITIRRLAFIKYIYQLGLQQSEMPEPLHGVALLTFHDAAELFLQVASEYLNTGAKQANFMDYWELLSKKLPTELGHKEAMRRLNKARVALKHHGTLPSKLDVEAFRATITNFFMDNTPLIFGIPFTAISLTDFVQPAEARDNLKEAERLLEEGQLIDALDKVALAFQQMLDDYEARKRDRFHRSPFFFGRDLTFYDSFSMGIGRSRHFADERQRLEYEHQLAEFVDRVKESLEAIQEAIKILAMGIDYRRYTRFKFFTPHIVRVMSGDYIIHRSRNQEEAAAEDVRFCIDFVVETAIKLQEFDYSLSSADS